MAGNHHGYEKFFIVCSPRSGSNLLVSYLDSHSGIRCYAEIFDVNEANRETARIYPKSRRLHQLFINAPDAFLEKHFFSRNYPKEILRVGFKLHYDHAMGEKGKRVWLYLASNLSIKVIHLQRRNCLASLLSGKRAIQTGAWTSLDKQHEACEEPIELPYEECLKYFKAIELHKIAINARFKNHHKIDVFYEDLVKDKANELQRILNLLALPNEDLRTFFSKQNTRPLSESIANYQELKQQFSATNYASFFETSE